MSDDRTRFSGLRRAAVWGPAAVIASVAVLAVLGPALLPSQLGDVSRDSFLPPSSRHWFGTDLNGRDLFYRVLLGAQISLLVGAAGAAISFGVGITYGLVAGYTGGA